MIPLSLLLGLMAGVYGQRVDHVGTVGGSGPKGGVGDQKHPMLQPAAWITDALIGSNMRQLHQGAPPKRLHSQSPGSGTHQVTIDTNQARQEMLGFGHSWTDSSVIVLGSLKPHLFDKVMMELFGQEGNNMGLMRHTIGSSDLSHAQYSYDDNGPWNDGTPDPELKHFDIGEHGRAMADMIAKMSSYKSDVTQFGSVWSPPSWMKHSNRFIMPDQNMPTEAYYYTNNTFNVEYRETYANYFAKYIDAFKERGATINAITPMNEPLNNQGGYPTMYLDPVEEGDLINQGGLGKLMAARDVGIWAYDHNTDMPMYPQKVVENAPGQVQAAAWHCYANPANYSVLDDFHYGNPDMLQFMTECSNGLGESGSVNFNVAGAFMPPVQHWASGGSMWVMATNENLGPNSPYGGCHSCAGSVIVKSEEEYYLTNDYYMIGHFSRFIRRGSFNYVVAEGNIGNEATPNQFYVIAVKNPDSSWAVVFMNNMNQDQEVALSFGKNGPIWQGTVPNATVVTWQLPASD